MLLRKTVKHWKNGLAISSRKMLGLALMFVMIGLTGCESIQQSEITTPEENSEIVKL